MPMIKFEGSKLKPEKALKIEEWPHQKMAASLQWSRDAFLVILIRNRYVFNIANKINFANP